MQGPLRSGLVLRSQSGFVQVLLGDGEELTCRLRGRFKKAKRAVTDLVVIGDRVRVRRTDVDGEGVIEEVENRRSRFARRQPGSRGRYKEDVLIANLDLLVVVMASSEPPPNPRLIDRFLVMAEYEGIEALLVANKADEATDAVWGRVFGPYEALGYGVLATSAVDGRGIEALRERLDGRISAFVGPSGVGKSSLMNALRPGLGIAVAALSEHLSKGRHTTRVAQLHPLGAGWVADTPGIRELASFDLPPEALAACFRELRPLVDRCRFGDCLHDREPGCAVKEAVEEGTVRLERYESYLLQLHGEER
jgi:ribosome biogenesis GTPase